MHLRRKVRNRIILVVVLVFAFVYWRGSKSYAKENKLECNYHLVYAICKQTGKATIVPTIWDVIKAGAKF